MRIEALFTALTRMRSDRTHFLMSTMASKRKDGKATPKKFSREDLACAICLDCLKAPKLLPCLHTYCKACLEGLLRKSKNGQITCPQCRVNHPLPTGGVGEFPADRVLENALDVYTFEESQVKHTAVPCSMCTEDDPSVAHCSTCGKFLCDFCAKAHKRQVNFRDHKTVTLDQLSSDVVKSLERPRYCTHHPEETLKLYCTTCQTLVCRDCSIIAHRDHSFKFAKDARSEVQLQLEQAVKGVTTKQQEFEAHLAFIKEAEKTRNAYSVSLSQQVNQAFDSYIRSLELLRKQLLGKEATAKVSDMKQIWAQKQSIEMTLANIASGLRYAERLRSCPSDVDMLAMSSKAREQLVSLQKAQWNPKSNLTCSPLLLFSSKGQEHVKSTAALKAVSPDIFTISIQPQFLPVTEPASVEREISRSHIRPRMSSTPVSMHSPVQHTTVLIGQKVQLLVEVRAEGKMLIAPLTVPSISITSGNSHYSSRGGQQTDSHSVKYTMKHRSGGVWLVEFMPLHAGQFTVCAAISIESNTENPQFNQYSQRQPDYYMAVDSGQYSQRPPSEVYHTVAVSGTFNIGGRVQQGPDWVHENADGGIGNKGTIITQQEYSANVNFRGVATSEQSFGRMYGYSYHGQQQFYVRWDNGNYGQYPYNEHGPHVLELIPDELM